MIRKARSWPPPKIPTTFLRGKKKKTLCLIRPCQSKWIWYSRHCQSISLYPCQQRSAFIWQPRLLYGIVWPHSHPGADPDWSSYSQWQHSPQRCMVEVFAYGPILANDSGRQVIWRGRVSFWKSSQGQGPLSFIHMPGDSISHVCPVLLFLPQWGAENHSCRIQPQPLHRYLSQQGLDRTASTWTLSYSFKQCSLNNCLVLIQ